MLLIRMPEDKAKAEKKALLSRKSCAYKKARLEARKAGKSEEEVIEEAKRVTWLEIVF